MFSLRIHSLDSPFTGDGCSAGDRGFDRLAPLSASSSSAPPAPQASPSSKARLNPRVQVLKGSVHLYRSPRPPSPDPSYPDWRKPLLFVLAVPTRLSDGDFLRFCAQYTDYSSEIQLIRNDGLEDRYSALIKFEDQAAADKFHHNVDGWRFSTNETEVCHVLFVASVEYTDSIEIAGTPPVGCTELPTCPVCLERLDQDISGIVATTCDHSFHCACISKWINSSCSVCHFYQEHSEKPKCSICGTSENLWICVICGFVGCGRYNEGHTSRHWKETQHCYSLDLDTRLVWDYEGDTYVHRLNQSKNDVKSDKSESFFKAPVDGCESCKCGNSSGISSALFNSRIEAIVDEYNSLLASQIETQRQYYENLILEEKEKRKKYVSEAVEEAVILKVQNVQLQLENVMKEKKEAADTNQNLLTDQKALHRKFKEIEESERETLKQKDEEIRDLEEQIRDITFSIEAQKVVANREDADDIRGGTVMEVPASQLPSSKSRRSSRSSKKK